MKRDLTVNSGPDKLGRFCRFRSAIDTSILTLNDPTIIALLPILTPIVFTRPLTRSQMAAGWTENSRLWCTSGGDLR
jgi:hypothetical protein